MGIDPGQIKGVKPLPFAQLRAGFPFLSKPGNKKKAVSLTKKQFRYSFGNAITEAESDELFAQWTIPGPGKPLFEAVVEEFLEFIGDAPLVIHNASFDLKFLNSELHRVKRPPIPLARAIDTIDIAKSKLPGARYSLDELCKRFSIDLTSRTLHGALLDSQLTAQVYQELLGGRQKKLLLSPQDEAAAVVITEVRVARVRPEPLAPRVTEVEIAAHALFVEKELKEPVWNWA